MDNMECFAASVEEGATVECHLTSKMMEMNCYMLMSQNLLIVGLEEIMSTC